MIKALLEVEVQLENVTLKDLDVLLERLANLGPVGSKGEIGARGEKGDKGDTGGVGQQGPIGPRGSTGPRGAQGVNPLTARGHWCPAS